MDIFEYIIILFLLIKIINGNINETNTNYYCDKELCKKLVKGKYIYTRHIGCFNKNSDKKNNCAGDCEVFPMKETIIDNILNLHNDLRNKVAAGSIDNHPPASKMPIMQWDAELSYLAGLHVRRCIFDHDECRNTKNFKFSGQNIAKQQSTAFKNTTSVIKELFDIWATEHKHCNRSIIEKYANLPKEAIGHFTVMVSDKASRVGCAVHMCTDSQQYFKHTLYLTCNYSYTNIKNRAIYKEGEPGTECSTGCDNSYKALCSKNETVNARPNA